MSTRLAIVPSPDVSEAAGNALRVAFATGDRRRIDQHFGSTDGFLMYLVTAEGHALAEAVRFSATDQDGKEDKLAERIAALDGCAAVYVQAVGSSAIQRLLANGVQPIKVPPGLPVAKALTDLKKEIADSRTPWIVRALKVRKDPSRFKSMTMEEWDE
ncbi:MAG: hypothetical protein JXQ84_02440 [Rhodospirillaceae bacterium]|nr:hypothetical protein [Rhodospirillaceae bacterium]